MAQRVAGTCYIRMDGQQFSIKGGVECSAMPTSREAVMSLTGLAGYKEMAQRQFIKLTAIFTRDFPVALLKSSTDMTITAELANGKVFVLAGSYVEGEIVAKGDDGEMDLEFTGTKGIWN